MPHKNRTTAKKALDKVFSHYIRLRATDENGYGNCFTCGQTYHWTEVDCGHFMSRVNLSTRYDELNCQFQCKHCNISNSGQQYEFGVNLNWVYGPDTAESIVRASKQLRKFTLAEYEEMIKHYMKKVDELRGAKNI